MSYLTEIHSNGSEISFSFLPAKASSKSNDTFARGIFVMLPKTPKPAIWRFIKGSAKTLFVLEAVCFAASYGLYYRMNTDRDFRRYINENYPFALDYYYKIGEIIGDNTVRQTDASHWSSTVAQIKKTE